MKLNIEMFEIVHFPVWLTVDISFQLLPVLASLDDIMSSILLLIKVHVFFLVFFILKSVVVCIIFCFHLFLVESVYLSLDSKFLTF